ncbi:porin [Ralstonia mojiangensis]|uniref:Porin n=2 Tax=Ralstonia mojiangensis TaxID=2953895 RepID=A0AAE3LAN5_9RALS|nr:porin [Ralstonia mojiangensis]MCO5411004.1 porin [Ralstonia mojiangensis]MCT7295410.1 porin [Ralstonia mojiangensis]MCT7313653.1 porin [Ralstonia mojiangensis]MCT7316234.1 porin [Ralstonia mojiangensis]
MRETNACGAALAVLTTLLASSAMAQSSVQLYGLVDAGLRYETNAVSYGPDGTPLSTGSRIGLTPGGGMTESYWGIKGREDLGGGLKGLFQLESHFNPANGRNWPEGSAEFFQIASVGIESSTLGQLSLGRQYNVVMEGVTMVYGSNLWAGGDQDQYVNLFKPEHIFMAGSKTNKMIHYGAQLGDVVFLAQYAPGGQPGSFSRGSQVGLSLSYVPEQGPVKLGASFLRTKDDNLKARFDVYTAGAQLALGGTTIHAGYIENRRDNNFTSFANGPFSPTDLAGLGIIAPEQTVDPTLPGGFDRRRMIFTGISYHVTPAFVVAANGWFTRQTGYTDAFDGSANQYQLVAGYFLSKRTLLYAEIDRARYKGGLVGAQLVGLNTQSPTISSNQTGMMIGMRHSF